MEQSFDVSDSTDWLDTPLSLLAPLESSLRCQVCKDFYDNPVITSCSHTFCSLCIRRCLSAEGKCPTCRTQDQELKLRRNWLVQELVEQFQNARQSILALAKKGAARIARGDDELREPSPKKRKVGSMEEPGEVVKDSSSQRVRTRSQRLDADVQELLFGLDMIEDRGLDMIEDSQGEDEDFLPEDGLVSCPLLCGRRMKEEVVFPHLDVCQKNHPSTQPKQSAFGSLQPQRAGAQNPPTDAPERLPAINYSLLKDAPLRKKFRDLGIPEWGSRALMQRRHTEWMNLWNANCDSKNPKSKKELLIELDVWERTQGGHAATQSRFASNNANTPARKDFDAAKWSANHDDDFKRLIANARKRSDAQVRSTIPRASAASESNEPEEPAAPVDTSLEKGGPFEINSDIEPQDPHAPPV